MGNPPKGTEVRFISPIVVESFLGGTSFPKRSFVKREVARIAFAMVSTTCGRTRVESADGKSVGIGITSWGAGIRLRGEFHAG